MTASQRFKGFADSQGRFFELLAKNQDRAWVLDEGKTVAQAARNLDALVTGDLGPAGTSSSAGSPCFLAGGAGRRPRHHGQDNPDGFQCSEPARLAARCAVHSAGSR
jgi:hypothetical protein